MIQIVAAANIDFILIQARLHREWGQRRIFDTSLYAVDGSRIKWVWLRSLAVHNIVLLCWNMAWGLVLRLFGRLFIDLTLITCIWTSVLINQPFELRVLGAATYGRIFEQTLNLSRKLSLKWGMGWYSIVDPRSRGYGISFYRYMDCW